MGRTFESQIREELSLILTPKFTPTAFTRLYSILRQNPESLENTGISLRAFTAFYTYYRIQILSSAPSKNLEAITVSRFFLFLVKTFLLRFGIVPSVGYIVGDIVVYFTDFVLQLTLLFMILSWAEDSSSSHEIDSVEYRQWLLHVQNTLAFG